MTETLIKWRLREVMARYNIKAIDLAREMGISANAVSNLRKANTMPRLDGDSLNKLCNALNKLALDLDREITPIVLIDYTRDLEPDDEQTFSNTNLKTQKTSKKISPDALNYPSSILSVISEVKSA